MKILDSVESSIFFFHGRVMGRMGFNGSFDVIQERKNTLFRRTNVDAKDLTS